MQRIPDTTADERLSGLERFMEFWFGPRLPEYGEPAENLVKLALPGSLRRFYSFANRWPPAFLPYSESRFHRQDRFLPLAHGPWGNIYRSGCYFVFAAENQGVWEAATLTNGDGPGVWVSEDCSHRTPNPKWRPLDNPLSHFLVSFVLQETMFGSNFLACNEGALSVFSIAGCEVEPVWLDGEYAHLGVCHSYFLIDRRILLRRDTGDIALDDQWYAYNDSRVAGFIDRLGLPSGIR